MGMTMVEKILARASGQAAVKAGDMVEPKVDLAMSHENGALVLNQFLEIYMGTGLEAKIWDPSKIAIIFDHRVPAESSKTATNQKKIREFVGVQGITKFHDIRGDEGGICHQILPENGYVRPGYVVIGTDSHTTSHGALGAFAFGIGATEGALGYNNMFVRGYEVNVIEGPRYILNKTTLKKRIFSRIYSMEGSRFKEFKYFPLSIYLKSYFDFGYVSNYPAYENSLPPQNTSLSDGVIAGTGFGLDIVSSYDLVLRFEYTLNRQGIGGFYFHIKKEF